VLATALAVVVVLDIVGDIGEGVALPEAIVIQAAARAGPISAGPAGARSGGDRTETIVKSVPTVIKEGDGGDSQPSGQSGNDGAASADVPTKRAVPPASQVTTTTTRTGSGDGGSGSGGGDDGSGSGGQATTTTLGGPGGGNDG